MCDSEIIRASVPKAQKDYRCDSCGRLIQKGTRYLRLFGGVETWGKATTLLNCLDCLDGCSDVKVIDALKKANCTIILCGKNIIGVRSADSSQH